MSAAQWGNVRSPPDLVLRVREHIWILAVVALQRERRDLARRIQEWWRRDRVQPHVMLLALVGVVDQPGQKFQCPPAALGFVNSKFDVPRTGRPLTALQRLSVTATTAMRPYAIKRVQRIDQSLDYWIDGGVHRSAPRGWYWMASARCIGAMRSSPARSAMVRATLRTRW